MKTIDQLEKELSETTDPAEYDRLEAEIQAAQKAKRLDAARRTRAERERLEAERQEKVTLRVVLIDRAHELSEQAGRFEDGAFKTLRDFGYAVAAWDDTTTEQRRCLQKANALAGELGLGDRLEFRTLLLLHTAGPGDLRLALRDLVGRFADHLCLIRKEALPGLITRATMASPVLKRSTLEE